MIMEQFSRDKLEQVAKDSLYATVTGRKTIEYSFEVFSRYIRPRSAVLELGPAEGLMSEKLLAVAGRLTVVEGSKKFAELIRSRLPDVQVVNALFEEAAIEEVFDHVILGHVLEHVENPQLILQRVKQWLKPGATVLCAVPNANSIHRQAAVEMGLIPTVTTMSEKDKHHGHLRIYDPASLQAEFTQAGFSINAQGGYWLKPLPDGQLESQWSESQLDAFMRLGEKFPAVSAEIYLVASVAEASGSAADGGA